MPKFDFSRIKNYFSGFKFPPFVSNLLSNKKKLYVVIGIFLLIIISLFSWQIYVKKSTEKLSSSGEHSPSSTPCIGKIIPEGKQEFTFSHGKDVFGPKPSMVTVDPLDPDIGKPQTISIKVKHQDPIFNATATIEVNDSSKNITAPLKLVSGSDTDGTWSITWNMPASYDCYYHIKFLFQSGPNEKDVYQGGLKFR